MNKAIATTTAVSFDAARAIARESWNEAQLESKISAIRSYAAVLEGQMNYDEFIEIADHYARAAESSDPTRVAFAKVFFDTLDTLSGI
jgi:hypothetical protein